MNSSDHSDVRPAILALGTAVPPYRYEQAAAARWMVDSLGASPALARWLTHLYALSGIETRHSCLPDGMEHPSASRFAPGTPDSESMTTSERMVVYEREATQVGVAAAQRALTAYARQVDCDDLAEITASITHVIAVSCTGFFAPGLDQSIAKNLQLRPDVQRTLVGFMGCAAAFNALRLADQIVRADSAARVLVVCVELCSLHIQPGTDRTNLIVASLFSDGAAACLVGCDHARVGHNFQLRGFHTHLAPNTEENMIWHIGNHGFTLRLDPTIPIQLGMVAPQALHSLLGDRPLPSWWAIHPGGRAIVDRLVDIFNLRPDQAAPSYDVLRTYGNMSSPTILFILSALQQSLHAATMTASDGIAMAFGPGLVTEMARLTYVPRQPTSVKQLNRRLQGGLLERVAQS